MLQSLYIENIAVIEKTNVEFGAGLNILTGETGAGKSIVIDSINAVLGGRISKELVRTGADKARVTAIFDSISDYAVEALNELGAELDDDGSLIMERTIKLDGKSTFRVNGRPFPSAAIKQLGQRLINIHGQNDSQLLLLPEKHIRYIDKAAERDELFAEFTSAYEHFCDIDKQLKKSQMDESERAKQIDMLRYQINEIEEAEVEVGETDELTARRNVLLNSEKVAELLHETYSSLYDDEESNGATDLISIAARSLAASAEYLPELSESADRLQDLYYELQDITETVRDSFSQCEYDPKELDGIEERLDMLHKLSRKYGATEEQILDFLKHSNEELSRLENSEETLAALKSQRSAAHKHAMELAVEISRIRRLTADEFEKSVISELKFLNMPRVKFVVSITPCELCANGIDRVEFFISVNPGEEPKPISKIASGGELSRIMLAIKNVIARNDDIETLIFDEIDTGVSGSAAQKIGLKLHQVSNDRQVICITHLAQIAAQADVHLLIKKDIEGDRTFTTVTQLDAEGCVDEVARIMGGIEITALTRENARELIGLAHSDKN